jgi:hypothetical protein
MPDNIPGIDVAPPASPAAVPCPLYSGSGVGAISGRNDHLFTKNHCEQMVLVA